MSKHKETETLDDQTLETAATSAAHPEEMKAEAEFRAGKFSMRATARATPAGIVATAVLLSAILIPLVFAKKRRG